MAKKGRRSDYRPVGNPASAGLLPARLKEGLNEAEDLMAGKTWTEARELLESLNARHPRNADVLGELVNVNYELHDNLGYQAACEQMVQVTPDDPDVAYGLGGAYMTNMLPVLALRQFERCLARFPDYERAAETREIVAELKSHTADYLEDLKGFFRGDGGDNMEGMALAEQHERMRSTLNQGHPAQTRAEAERLLSRWPAFTPALNNLSLAYFLEGQGEQAIAAAQRALGLDAQNCHALSNMVRYLCVMGRFEEARPVGERLKAAPVKLSDHWNKKAETFSFLGDDEAVLETFAEAQRSKHVLPVDNAMLHHYAAVVELRREQETLARDYWKKALSLSPGLVLASDNLDDLRKPIGQRHAPWAFSLRDWGAARWLRN